MSCSFGPRSLALALAACLLSAAGAHAADVCLVAKPFTPATGATTGVPMWGYAQVAWSAGTCDWAAAAAAVATSPGPRITVPPTDTLLTIHLKNELPVPTSIIIPGLPSPGTPSRHTTETARATSFTAEVPAGTASTTPYTWTVSRPGTFLYQSGSHVQVQVQMGLYGAMTRDNAAGEAYPGKAYLSEVVLFYSEVDPALHQAVATGAYGGLLPVPAPGGGFATPTMTSTFNYKPRFFLVNGDAYPGAATTVAAGAPNTPKLIRFLNAGLRTHVPVLQNGDFELVAEDAHPYAYSRRQYELSLFAGKTMDVLWTPPLAGTYTVYDRSPHLTTDGGGPGGMIAKLAVAGTVIANDDAYGARNDKPLVVAAPGVMANDSAITTAMALTPPVDSSNNPTGTLLFDSAGSFTYTAPAAFTGLVTFTYQQPASNIATVRINVSPNAAPIAANGTATTNEDTAVAITLQATDANGDALTYTIVATASTNCAAPLAKGILTGTGANRTYTPNANANGTDCFEFQAADDLALSNVAKVTVNITPVNDTPTAASATVNPAAVEDTPITITLAGGDADIVGGVGDTLTFTITSPPANGTLSALTQVPPTGATVTYTPKANWNGTDSFRFTTKDLGLATSPVATITIPVTPVADIPIAANESYTVKYNVTTTLDVLANDKDPDGTPLKIKNLPVVFPKCFNSTTGALISEGGTCAAGTDKVTINSTANRLTFVPNPVKRNRVITFTYQALDGNGGVSASPTSPPPPCQLNTGCVTVSVTR